MIPACKGLRANEAAGRQLVLRLKIRVDMMAEYGSPEVRGCKSRGWHELAEQRRDIREIEWLRESSDHIQSPLATDAGGNLDQLFFHARYDHDSCGDVLFRKQTNN